MKTLFVIMFIGSAGYTHTVSGPYDREVACAADRRHLVFEMQIYPNHLKCVAVEVKTEKK